jgi:hypothetical protein
MDENTGISEIVLIAEKIKNACIRTALESFESASNDGICCEGAWECAIDAIKNINTLEILIHDEQLRKDV